jgi:dTDP-L-rhamnose 4-epimerase
MHLLVTGGAGFVGSHLVDALVAGGHRVRVLDALLPQVHAAGWPCHLHPLAELVRGDVGDREALSYALDGVEAVFHLAAEVGVGQSMYEMGRYVQGNSLGTATLLEALVERRRQIRKLIVASSNTVYGEGAYRCPACGAATPRLRPVAQLLERRWEVECAACESVLEPVPTSEDKPLQPGSVYAVTKQDQEQMCLLIGRAYDIPTVALRFFNIYGTRQALSNPYTGVCAIFSARLLNGSRPLIFEDGEQTRDLIHVSDIVRANLLALETDRADYQAVNVGTGRATSIREIARLLAQGLGAGAEPEITGRYREGDTRHCIADITRVRALLGFEPRVRLEEGIAELLEWVRRQDATDLVLRATRELEVRQLCR